MQGVLLFSALYAKCPHYLVLKSQHDYPENSPVWVCVWGLGARSGEGAGAAGRAQGQRGGRTGSGKGAEAVGRVKAHRGGCRGGGEGGGTVGRAQDQWGGF